MNERLCSIFDIEEEVRSFTPSDQFSSNDTLVGVEVELEKIQGKEIDDVSRFWKWDRDGSLREGGVEFVLRQPLLGKDLEDAISSLSNALKKIDYDASFRTSLHVHVDARSMTHQQISNFIIIYCIFERVLFKYSGGREYSEYCVPNYMSEDQKKHLASFSTILGSLEKIHRSANRAERYAGLNIASLTRFGSLEVRSHRGTGDGEEIRNWVNILLEMKKFSDQTKQGIVEIFTNMSKEGMDYIVSEVFSDTSRKLLEYDGWKNDLKLGLRTAQEVYYGNRLEQVKIPDHLYTEGSRRPLMDEDINHMGGDEIEHMLHVENRVRQIDAEGNVVWAMPDRDIGIQPDRINLIDWAVDEPQFDPEEEDM